MNWMEQAQRDADDAWPTWDHLVPMCNESCKHHDGKRCELLGLRPGTICEPVVRAMGQRLHEEKP